MFGQRQDQGCFFSGLVVWAMRRSGRPSLTQKLSGLFAAVYPRTAQPTVARATFTTIS